MKKALMNWYLNGGDSAAQQAAATDVTIPGTLTVGVLATVTYSTNDPVAEAKMPPYADRVVSSGTFEVGGTITFTIQNVVGTLGNCIWRIYRSDNLAQSNEALVTTISNVSGAVATYVVTSSEIAKYPRVEVDLIGTAGEVGETLYSVYGPQIPSNEFWTSLVNAIVNGDGDYEQNVAGTGTAESTEIIPAANDAEYVYRWDASTVGVGKFVGLLATASSITQANMLLNIEIVAASSSFNIYEGTTYKTTITNITPTFPGVTTLDIKLTVSRATSKILVLTSTNGLAYVLKFTYSGTLSAIDLKVGARTNADDSKVVDSVLTII